MKTNDKKDLAAKILEKAARGSVKVAVNSRCMYCLHQPKQPESILNKLKLECSKKTLLYV